MTGVFEDKLGNVGVRALPAISRVRFRITSPSKPRSPVDRRALGNHDRQGRCPRSAGMGGLSNSHATSISDGVAGGQESFVFGNRNRDAGLGAAGRTRVPFTYLETATSEF